MYSGGASSTRVRSAAGRKFAQGRDRIDAQTVLARADLFQQGRILHDPGFFA
jgi:hypothetical protein